jgi:hydroxymethylpyrimidine/phosphomethylpyrimidine kinase
MSASSAARRKSKEMSGIAVKEAVKSATDYVQGALALSYPLGRGHGPVNHLFAIQPRVLPLCVFTMCNPV